MNDLIINLLRGSVTAVMNVILLITLTRSKFGRNGTVIAATSVFVINMASTLWFYVHGDLTALSRFDIIMFLVIGLALKPMTRLSFMQWSFTFLTTLNIMMMIIFLSFDLSRSLPMPPYAHTLLRLMLYLGVIVLFQKYLRMSYESVVDNWPMFSVLVTCIFLNLSYYFYATDDIQKSLTIFKWPLYLLVTLSLAAYGTVFYSLKKFMAMYALETENLKIQNESGLLHQAALKLEKYANYDTLTGLPNRRYFFERLDQVVAECDGYTGKFALLYIDLDGFKDINDRYGHEVGDAVLIEVGNRLSQNIRKEDIVARLGGDEFAIVFRDIEDTAITEHLARKIHTLLQEPMYFETIGCTVDASIGIATYPAAGDVGEKLLRHADSAMYDIKRNGKGGIGFFREIS